MSIFCHIHLCTAQNWGPWVQNLRPNASEQRLLHRDSQLMDFMDYDDPQFLSKDEYGKPNTKASYGKPNTKASPI